jgi:F-type H+-transporting ATPase subunit gamma
MASLKDMRNQITSVKATQKITKAMQMVAAAKLKRATDAAEASRPYATRLMDVINNLARGISGDDAPLMLTGTGKDQNHLVVVATADRGLCGGFNSSIVRAARELIQSLIKEGKSVRIVTIGRKGRDQLKRVFADHMVQTYDLSGHKSISLDVISPIIDYITEDYMSGRSDIVTLFYSQYRSVVSQVASSKRLVPAEISAETAKEEASYEYEPGEAEILETLLPRNLATQILSALLENNAGFYASQMSAMDNATRNAGDMINALTLKYNRSRQAQITKELIEIISGAEAI